MSKKLIKYAMSNAMFLLREEIVNPNIDIKFQPQDEYKYCDEYVKIPCGLTRKDEDGKWIDERNLIADTSKAFNDFGYKMKL